jgi:hypothetical protein
VNAIGQDRAAAPHFIHLSAKPGNYVVDLNRLLD